MQTRTFRTADIEIAKTGPSPVIPSPFRWLRDLNATFVAYFKFKNLTAEQLHDMGITRRQQDQAFLRQFAPRDDR